MVVKSADYAIKYATELAQGLRLPKYVIGFLVVAIISILPETFISINSALQGFPAFGLGTLFGSNVADLTLVFAIIVFSTTNGIKVGSKILENNKWYPFLLTLPIIVGFDGYYSRLEGAFLIITGLYFYYWIFKKNNNHNNSAPAQNENCHPYQNLFYLILSMAVLLFGAHLTVKYGGAFAESIGLNPILIGILIVGLGTTLPELLFSLKALKQKGDSLALGDILGTVISDATIVVGILALINPFYFPQKIVYLTAMFMVTASLILFIFLRSGKTLTKKEGVYLFIFYLIFVVTEFLMNK